MRGTSIPVYYYTFADTEDEALQKVRMKWGEYDPDARAIELRETEIENLVIATDYFG